MMLEHGGVSLVVLGWIYCFRFAVVGESITINDDIILHHAPTTGSSESIETHTRNETCNAPTRTPYHESCGVWLALSTIPGAGNGMFAGKGFRAQEVLMLGGEQAIPIVDPDLDLPAKYAFYLLYDYTWAADSLYMEDLGREEVSVLSPGLGAAINSMPDFNNVRDTFPVYSVPHGLHRRSDPGAGAITYYHSRKTKALTKINQGDELLVYYRDTWFLERKHELGPVPLEGDHAHADSLYRKMRRILNNDQTVCARPNEEPQDIGATPQPSPRPPKKIIAEELWDKFVLGSPWDDSPTMAALQLTKEEYEALDNQSLEKIKKDRLSRSLEWLQENGVCADTVHMGLSTIRQAGHGAFASWPFRKGTVVLPVPLTHTPNRVVMHVYAGNPRESTGKRMPPQLLLNYCMGHRDSTLLLSPYGPRFSLINHNQTLANVRLQWASPQRSQHNPDLLNMTVDELVDIQSAKLAMELVALRDIEAGEEIFLDYGEEWETAWQKHVLEWQPVEGADTYISAFEMNEQFDHVFRTESEQEEFPYPPNLMIKFHYYFFDNAARRLWLKSNPIPWTKSMEEWQEEDSGECRVTGRHLQEHRTLYTILVRSDQTPNQWVALENVPREALFFQDRPHTTDMFLENAFRHDLRIPDELFPEKWKNRKRRRYK